MSDSVDQARRAFESRLSELRPVVAEYERLEAAVAALAGLDGTPAAPSRTRVTRPRSTAVSTPSRRGRPRGSGQRGAQVLKVLKAHPGITTAGVAKELKIKPNYLYRVIPDLERDGKVRREGKGWAIA